MKNWIKELPLVLLIVLSVILVVAIIPIGIVLFMALWNSTIPGITGWNDIDFIQALAIVILAKVLSS